MTEDDLMKTYEMACQNAVVYGVGLVKIAMINGGLELSVVPPEAYQALLEKPPEDDTMPLFDDWPRGWK